MKRVSSVIKTFSFFFFSSRTHLACLMLQDFEHAFGFQISAFTVIYYLLFQRSTNRCLFNSSSVCFSLRDGKSETFFFFTWSWLYTAYGETVMYLKIFEKERETRKVWNPQNGHPLICASTERNGNRRCWTSSDRFYVSLSGVFDARSSTCATAVLSQRVFTTETLLRQMDHSRSHQSSVEWSSLLENGAIIQS